MRPRKSAEEITRIHSAVMQVPKNFVRVVFLSYPRHSEYAAGEMAPTVALNCVLRSGLCCSTPWSSKGYKRGQTWISEQMSDALWRWSDEGKLPVVVDAASCTLGLKDDLLEHLDDERKDRLKRITIIDSIAWCKDLLPSLSIHKTIPAASRDGSLRNTRHTVSANRTCELGMRQTTGKVYERT
jgi:hypothetical protein